MNNPYALQFAERAVAHLSKLDKPTAARIIAKLEWLAEHADTVPHTPLKGQWSGHYHLRVGDYGVICFLKRWPIIIVEVIGHRREIYDE